MSGRHEGPVIAVVGAASVTGRRIAAVLAEQCGTDRSVVCVGPRRTRIDGATWRIVDPRDPALARKLADVDALVLAHLHGELDADGGNAGREQTVGAVTDSLITAADAANVRHVVLLSNAQAVGARRENSVPLPEDSTPQLRAQQGIVAEWVHAEQRVRQWAADSDGRIVTVLRPGVVVGRGVDTALTRHFEVPRVVVIDDERPPWALTHVDDLASATAYVVREGLPGTFAVASSPWLGHDELLAGLGKRAVRLPSAFAAAALDRLHRVGVSSAPADELDFVRYPWVLDPQALAEHGWAPAFTATQTLEVFADHVRGRTAIVGRRVGRPDATSLGAAGAAGAAAAVLGGAAIIRARRQRGG